MPTLPARDSCLTWLQPCLTQPITGSGRRAASGLCWQSHHVPPRQASWSCLRQLRQIMVSFLTAGWPANRRPHRPQAALVFARRIRRRRSAERSSSLSPPQVPYFSGRLTA
jgi:hypothetical protein